MDAPSEAFSAPLVVKWSDFDPAGFLHPSRTLSYAMDVLEAWFRDEIGITWQEFLDDLGIDTPTVHAECDYLRPPRADLTVGFTVRVEKVGRTSMTFLIDGRDAEGHHYFRIRMVMVCVSFDADYRPVEMPADLRRRMSAYQAACGDA